MKVLTTNGLEIAYERVGNGPPLVFVHGAGLDCRMWQPQLAALADQFTVVAWDEPGAGHSSNVPADLGLADYASCLAALVDALDLGPAHGAGLIFAAGIADGDATFETEVPSWADWDAAHLHGPGCGPCGRTGVFPENPRNLDLHVRVGFRVVGRRERLGTRTGSRATSFCRSAAATSSAPDRRYPLRRR